MRFQSVSSAFLLCIFSIILLCRSAGTQRQPVARFMLFMRVVFFKERLAIVLAFFN